VSGGKGVVVGDYNTVFQSFADGSRPVTALIRSAQFRPLVDERTRTFVGREFVFEGVERATAGADAPSGYVVIRGEPGIGKTAIAATLVVRNGWVHHFNIAPENIRSPKQFLENVCAQLVVRYELDHATLPPEAGEDAGFLTRLLVEAAEKAKQNDDLPVVVVVDALDEAEDTGLPASANRLFLPRALPEGVFFVVSTREEADYRLDVDNETDIWVRDDDPKNRADVTAYTEAFLDAHPDAMAERLSAWQVDRPAFVSAVAEMSEGNFMYLVHVLPEIERGTLAPAPAGGIAGLPRGLKGYYQRHWRDMKDADPDRFTRTQRPVLCLLAISREPVTLQQILDWAHLDLGDVRAVVREWREFLDEDDRSDPAKYRIYHRSFADFLDQQEDLRHYHDLIASAALAKIPGL
jgi:hypothetical protein